MGLNFFWRCEAAALDSILDLSTGDNGASLINSAAISAAAARVGTNGLLRPTGTTGGATFFPNSIFPGDIAAPANAVGCMAMSIREVTNLTNTNNFNCFAHFRSAASANSQIGFQTQAGGNISAVCINNGGTASRATTTTGPRLANAWRGIVCRFDLPGGRLAIEVYDENNVLLEKQEITNVPATSFPPEIANALNGLRWGFGTTSVAGGAHHDNCFVGNTYDEPVQNNFTITEVGEYDEGGVGPGIEGGIAATEARDTFAGEGTDSHVASIVATEARDVLAASGLNQKQIAGTLATNEVRDTATLRGDVFNPNELEGGIAATEQRDTAAMSGSKRYAATIAATEARDTAALAGLNQKQIDGTLATLEGFDLAAIRGDTFLPGEIVGGLGATEARDLFAATGAKVYAATIAAIEQRDAAALSGTNYKRVSGTLAALESSDTAFITDGIGEEEVTNTIAARDANFGIGISPEQKWTDGAPSWGRNGSDPEVELPAVIGQTPDVVNWTNNASNRQMRLLQAISDTPPLEDVLPGWASYTGAKAGEWVWCLNRSSSVADKDNPIGLDDATAI